MLRQLLNRPILALKLSELEHFPRLAEVLLEFNYNKRRSGLVFQPTHLKGLSPETRHKLADLTGDDIYRGYYWQIAENPQNVGFWFYSRQQECQYLTNIPYLVLHHSQTGFAWGYNGSGPTDLGLNLGEYFCIKLGWTKPTVKLWKEQTASYLAYAARGTIRDWLNQALSTGREQIQYQEAEQAVTEILTTINKNAERNNDK